MCRYVAMLAVLMAAGCQKSGYKFTEVEGTVTLAGAPQPGVMVCFWPDADAGSQAPRASAVTDASGRYRLRCDEGTDGAVIGKYRVCVSTFNAGGRTLTMPPKIRTRIKENSSAPLPLPPTALAASAPVATKLPAKYASYKETPLRDIEVAPGAPQTLDFDLITDTARN